MKYAHVFIIVALAAGLTIGAAAANPAGPGYNGTAAQTKPHGRKGDHNPPHGFKCERGLYGETHCTVSPNGRVFGPTPFDYAVGTGQHIQR